PVEIFSYGRQGDYQVNRLDLSTGTTATNELNYDSETGTVDVETQPLPTHSPTPTSTPTPLPTATITPQLTQTPTPTPLPTVSFNSLVGSIQASVKSKQIKSSLVGTVLILEVRASQILSLSKHSYKTVNALKIVKLHVQAATPK